MKELRDLERNGLSSDSFVEGSRLKADSLVADPSELIKAVQPIQQREHIVFAKSSNKVMATYLEEFRARLTKLVQTWRRKARSTQTTPHEDQIEAIQIGDLMHSIEKIRNIIRNFEKAGQFQLEEVNAKLDFIKHRRRTGIFIDEDSINEMILKCRRAYRLYPDKRLQNRKGLTQIIGEQNDRAKTTRAV